MMDWQEKLDALQELGECDLKMRKPGDWYVSQRYVDVKDGGCLIGKFGDGEDPELAVEDHWRQYVDELPDEHVIVVRSGGNRRELRWTGHMWKDVL